MEHPAWRAFLKHKTNIFDDLDVKDILDELFSEEVLSLDEYEYIQSKQSRLDRNDIFLKKLPFLTAQKFTVFLNSLEKKYSWLYEKLQSINNVGPESVTVYEDILIKGNIPSAPPHYVERKQQLQNLADLLKKVKPMERVVVHGMTGCGKSCLVAATIKNTSLLETCFKNKVFWINLREVKTDEQLISCMKLLLQRLIFDLKEVSNTDEFYQLLKTNSLHLEHEINTLKNWLILFFAKEMYRNSLIILDNANTDYVVNVFDVGCKVLITTQDKQIVRGSCTFFLEVKEGFTEEETLLLFANCLQITTNKLSPHASKVHRLCKGQPLVVALIGSLIEQYKEEILNSPKKWKHYIKKLSEKDFNLGSSKNNETVLFQTIELCIKNLDSDLQECYKSLAVFVEEVNITPKALQTLWNSKDIYEVEDIMVKLQNKSLIVSHYSQDIKTYVYGIHALLLAYLKQKFTKEKMIELHKMFVKAYKDICGSNFAKLPDDNYIFQYLGYHLSEAQMYDEFKRIYFDLNFIGAKIKAVGIGDLLKDFQIYKKYIIGEEGVLESKLKDYEQFIKTKGQDLFKFKHTNIIQSALELKKNSVYETALKVAQKNPQYLYFLLHAPEDIVYFTNALDLNEEVTAACFTNDSDQILVGTASGDITLWEQSYGGQLCSYNGHTKRIIYLQLKPDETEFLSVSEDGCVKIWNLEESISSCRNGRSPDGIFHKIPSPKVKQSPYTNFFGDDSSIDRSSRTFSLPDDSITSASFSSYGNKHLVTGCSSGKVIVWNLNDGDRPELTIAGRDDGPIKCVTFSEDDKLVIFSHDSNIMLYDAQNGQFVSQFCNEHVVNTLLIVPEFNSNLIAISDHSIALWTWQKMNKNVVSIPAHTVMYENASAKVLCGTVTDDGVYLITGSSDLYIRMWNIASGKMVQEFCTKGKTRCLDVFFRDNITSDIILLTASPDTIKQWHINSSIQPSEKAKLLPIFDVHWTSASSLPRVAAITTENYIHIYNGQNLMMESCKFRSPIKMVCFSLCGNKITFGLENGDVLELEFKTKRYEKVMSLHGSISYLKYFDDSTTYLPCSRKDSCSGMKSGTLVAAAQNGWFSVYRNNTALCLVQPPSPSDLKQVPLFPIVECFYIKDACTLLSIAENRTVKAWNLNDASYVVLIGEKTHQDDNEQYNSVTMACLSNDQSLLAITMSNNTFDVYDLEINKGSLTKFEYVQGGCLKSALTCCCFSHDGSILALGHGNGLITIWSVELKEILYHLDVHKNEIHHLQFSPLPMFILVSVGEQIVWWDLLKVPKDFYAGESRRQKRKSLTIQNNLLSKAKSLYAGPWQDKQGSTDVPHLLSSIKVGGLYASLLSSNHDFTAFSTIDCSGNFYIMNLLTKQ